MSVASDEMDGSHGQDAWFCWRSASPAGKSAKKNTRTG